MIGSWISAFRPKTLTAAIVPIMVASSYAMYKGQFELWISVVCFLVACCIQIATNLFNDAIDFKKGADEKRIGPKRITQSGEASFEKVMNIAKIFLGISVVLGAPLVVHGGVPILLMGLFSMVFAYAYTGGPFPLAYLGIADLFVVLFFGIIAVSGVAFLQLGFWSIDFLVLGLQVGLLCNLMLVVNNLRDMESDRLVGKKTLVARLGEGFARSEFLVLYFLPFIFSWYWFAKFMNFTAFLVYLLFPFAIAIGFFFLQTPRDKVDKYLGISSLYYLLFGVLLSFGMVVDGV